MRAAEAVGSARRGGCRLLPWLSSMWMWIGGRQRPRMWIGDWREERGSVAVGVAPGRRRESRRRPGSGEARRRRQRPGVEPAWRGGGGGVREWSGRGDATAAVSGRGGVDLEAVGGEGRRRSGGSRGGRR
uniref:Uncharacterized protein n=1 Tax=Oryza glaberrima TaxID=4538 RepID=I1R6Y3_ORYGL